MAGCKPEIWANPQDRSFKLAGRKKNMIVTAEGKNIYPEDIELRLKDCRSKSFAYSPPITFGRNEQWSAKNC